MTSPVWRICSLGDLIELKRGYDLPTSQREDGPFPIVSSSGITGTHSEAKAKGPGVVTGRYGTLGEVFFITTDFWPLNTSLYVRDFKGNDPRYIAYLLKRLDLGTRNAAGAVPGLNRNHLHLLDVSAPPLPTQRRIASVLSAYDDLIENNTRRITILDEMARRLYEEWFVQFRFPGHEGAEFVETELGRVPKGWEIQRVGKLCESVRYGYTAKAAVNIEGPKFLRITDIVPKAISWADVPSCEIDNIALNKFLLREGDIVVARTGATTGYAKRLNKKFPASVFASYLVKMRCASQSMSRFLGVILESDHYKRFIQQHMGGAAQPNANAQVLASMPVIVPSENTLQRFDTFLEPLVDFQEILQIKSAKLRAQRDLLLPKLISGEIDVSNLPLPGTEDQAA